MIRETKVQLSFGLGSSRRTRSLRVLASLGIRLVLGLARSFSGPLLVVSSRLALCPTIFAHFPLLSFSQFLQMQKACCQDWGTFSFGPEAPHKRQVMFASTIGSTAPEKRHLSQNRRSFFFDAFIWSPLVEETK